MSGEQETSDDLRLSGGLDEAGRGAVIGPLVLALAWFDDAGMAALADLGIRDSKVFGSSRAARTIRADLAERVRELAVGWALAIASASEVDQALASDGLNALERRLARSLLSDLPLDCRVVADGRRIFMPLTQEFANLVAENKADASDRAVSAASILAKAERDRLLLEILQPYEGDFGPISGMGYPNRGTEAFLRRFHAECGRLPEQVRRSWKWPVLEELAGRQGKLPF